MARLSRPDVSHLLPHEKDVDVAALREELVVLEASVGKSPSEP